MHWNLLNLSCIGCVQYDTIAWPSSGVLNPNSQTPWTVTRIFNNARNYFSVQRNTSPLHTHYNKPFGLEEESKLSVHIHLEHYRSVLSGCLFDNCFRIESFSDDVNCIFNSLQCQKVKCHSLQVLYPQSLLQVWCWHPSSVILIFMYSCLKFITCNFIASVKIDEDIYEPMLLLCM